MKLEDIFYNFRHAQAVAGTYIIPYNWYPVLGIPGAIDIVDHTILHCKLVPEMEIKMQEKCFNRAINKIRIHRSHRSTGIHDMVVYVSDIFNEHEIATVPYMSDEEIGQYLFFNCKS